jgi:energy-coupling factor transporter transmembrane protein EcfT
MLAMSASLLLLALLVLPLEKKIDILRKAFYVCLLFSLLVSFTYFLIGLLSGQNRWEYLVMISLRSFSIALATFIAFRLINIYKVFDFSKSASLLMIIVSSHIFTYLRLFEEFKNALKSRTIGHIGSNVKMVFISRLLEFFFEKSIRTSEELYQAMKSRSFYD